MWEPCTVRVWNGEIDRVTGFEHTFAEGTYYGNTLKADGVSIDNNIDALEVMGLDCQATLYEDQDGGTGGWIATFPIGKYGEHQLDSHGADYNEASRLKVWRRNPKDCLVYVYEHNDFTGDMATFKGRGNWNYSDMIAAGIENDAASSVRVIGQGCKAHVYGGSNYRGWHAILPEGNWNAAACKRHGMKLDKASSFKVT